jgi:ATP-dependent Clp protease ATP-binding subunit ClpC
MHPFDRIRLAVIKTVNLVRRVALGCKWTPRAGQAAALARKEAAGLKHDCVHEMHLTLALGHLGEGLAAERLHALGFQYEQALAQAQTLAGAGTASLESTAIPFSDGVKQVVALARRISLRDGLWYIGTDHLLLALLQQPDPLLRQLIEAKGLAVEDYRKETEAVCRDVLQRTQLGRAMGGG